MKEKKNYLHKDAKIVLNKLANLKKEKKIKNIYELSPNESRKEFKKIRNYFKSKKKIKLTWTKDFVIKNFRIRHYRGKNNSSTDIYPIMIFFHGGGWVVGDLETHDMVCRKLVNNSKFDLIAVDYSLAPECVFPKAVKDAIATIKWLKKFQKKLKISLDRILVCGDSAGGNLAAVLSIYNRNILKMNIIFQILIYPVTMFSSDFPSKKKYNGLILSKELMQWFENKYLCKEDRKKYINDWRLSPAKAKSLKRLPKALILLAGCDPLLDEGKYYADLLKKNNIKTDVVIYDGQIHGFFTMDGIIKDANNMISLIKKESNSLLD